MPLHLHGASHDPERRFISTVMRDEAGNDRVKGALRAADPVRMAILKGEAEAAILKAYPGARDVDP